MARGVALDPERAGQIDHANARLDERRPSVAAACSGTARNATSTPVVSAAVSVRSSADFWNTPGEPKHRRLAR